MSFDDYVSQRTMDDLRKQSEMWPIRCFSCGKVLSNKQAKYEELTKSMTKAQAMNTLGLRLPCCRSIAMRPSKISLGLWFDHTGLKGRSQKTSAGPISRFPISSMNENSEHADDTKEEDEKKKKEKKIKIVNLSLDDKDIQAVVFEGEESIIEEAFVPYNISFAPTRVSELRAI